MSLREVDYKIIPLEFLAAAVDSKMMSLIKE